MAEVERVELRISMAKEAGFSGVVDVVTIQAAKLSLYSNELARRASDRAAAAADRASRSTRFLAVAAIFGSVILGIAQIVVTFTQRAK